MAKKNEDLLNQVKYESTNSFNQPCPHAWDKDKLYQYFIQHFLTIFFFLGYFLTSFVKNNAVYILFILFIVKSVFNSHKSISYQTFVSCYENRNIGKYQTITPDNILCVISPISGNMIYALMDNQLRFCFILKCRILFWRAKT